MSSSTKTKKNILFISHWYPSKKEPFNGIFIQKHEQALRLEYNVTRVHFDLLNKNHFFKIELIKEKSDAFTIRVNSIFYKYVYHILFIQNLLFKFLVRKFQLNMKEFDAILSNVIFPSGIVGSKIAQKHKISHYHIEHWSKFNKTLSHGFFKNSAKKTLKNVETIFCVSKILAQDVKKFTTNKVEIIPNVIDQTIFYNPTPKSKTESKINFLAVANWTNPKNPFLFLEALNKFYSQYKNFNLSIIGSGPLLNEVKSKNYPFDINYLGVKNSKEIAQELYKADFLLHGSNYESFSIIIIESLLSGTPVIVSNIGIASEVINTSNGIICNTQEDWLNAFKSINKITFDSKHIANEYYNQYDYKSISKLFKKYIH